VDFIDSDTQEIFQNVSCLRIHIRLEPEYAELILQIFRHIMFYYTFHYCIAAAVHS
jgi:hypothetical protein